MAMMRFITVASTAVLAAMFAAGTDPVIGDKSTAKFAGSRFIPCVSIQREKPHYQA